MCTRTADAFSAIECERLNWFTNLPQAMKHAIRNLLRELGAIIKTDHQGKSRTGREDDVGSLSALPLSFDLNREIQQLRYEERGVLP